ncbi:hypothetical protein TNCV_4261561 [Trichonephila clavipes]|nr:hypothetical protein TNCV_4261561 [Trichonephila clavipes]
MSLSPSVTEDPPYRGADAQSPHVGMVGKLEKGRQLRYRPRPLTEDRYLVLSARRHKWTKIPQLARDLAAVSGRKISRQTLHSRLAETVIYAQRPVLRVPLIASYWKDRLLRG